MNAQTQVLLIDGPVGTLQLSYDEPAGAVRGIAVVAHPHPLFGGTMDNKVVQTIARAFLQLGYAVARPNFRGVGASAGSYAEAVGERDDLLATVLWLRALHDGRWASAPLAMGGFSFGSAVTSHVAQALTQAGTAPERLVLVGTAASRFEVAQAPAHALVIHGEVDDVVPLSSVLDWARPQQLPVTILPGAGHFFHGMLPVLRRLVLRAPLADSATGGVPDAAAD